MQTRFFLLISLLALAFTLAVTIGGKVTKAVNSGDLEQPVSSGSKQVDPANKQESSNYQYEKDIISVPVVIRRGDVRSSTGSTASWW